MKLAFWLMAAALPLAAQPKLLINAQVDTRSAAAGLEREFRTLLAAQGPGGAPPAWIGYTVPAAGGVPVHWLADVQPAESVEVLKGLITSGPSEPVRRQAMSSLGRSRDPRALAFFEHVLKR